MSIRAAVIGAGPAGCAAAHQLGKAGRDVVIFERAETVGGRATSWRKDGIVVDSGAGFFTNFYPTLSRLLGELRITGEVTPLSRRNVLVNGDQEVEFVLGSVRSFLANPFVGAPGKFRMASRTAVAAVRHRGLELASPESLAALDDRSIEDEAIATMGEQAYDFLVRPGVEPFWYFSCAEVSRSLFLALQSRAPTAKFFTMRDGMDSIATALSAGHGLRLGVEVTEVVPDGDGVSVDGECFDEAVVATTADVTRRIVSEDLLDTGLGSFVESQRYVANLHACFRVRRDACPPESGRFPCGPGEWPVAAISFNSHKDQGSPPPDDEVVSVFLGAGESASLVSAPEDEQFRRAWELAQAFCPYLPIESRPLWCAMRERAIPIHEVGRYRLAAAAQNRQRGPVVLAGDYLSTATVDGALSSGIRAAERLCIPGHDRVPAVVGG